MQIIFNLTGLLPGLRDYTQAPEALAQCMLQHTCRNVGIPLETPPPLTSTQFNAGVYNSIELMVESELSALPTPSYAKLTHLRKGIFQLELL